VRPFSLALRRFSDASISTANAGKFLPDALHRRGEREDRYERLLTELSRPLDPLEDNPWPHHATIGREPWHKSHDLLPRWASGARQDAQAKFSNRSALMTTQADPIRSVP
jgi:hypothetical protein